MNRLKLVKVWPPLCFASHSQMAGSRVPERLTAALKSRNTDLLELLFDLVIMFKFCGRVLGWIPSIVHGADEFLDVNVIQSSTVGVEVV